MSNIRPPKYALAVLHRLRKSGFEAYMVGGCVRDMLMGRRPNDWDICTSALPEQVEGLFPRTHPTGLKHGTITVVSDGRPLEVTTFRTDGYYIDHRRPESVSFVPDLNEDLKRRDFTVNAIAMGPDGELRDPFGGLKDIERRIIRCVGKPEERFNEDSLRMLRALRFSATLGFELDKTTYAAIKKLSPLTGDLAAERASAELLKTLTSQQPEKVADMIELGLLARVLTDKRRVDLNPLSRLPKSVSARLSGLCGILSRDGVIYDCGEFLRALRLNGSTIKNVSAGVKHALQGSPKTHVNWKRLSSRIGDEGCYCAAAAAQALGENSALSIWRQVLKADECRSISQLAVSGTDLMDLGLKGIQVGAGLSALLEYVIDCPMDNRREVLLNIAKERFI